MLALALYAVAVAVVLGMAFLYVYTRSTVGFCKSTTDLSGKTTIVTGANTGGEMSGYMRTSLPEPSSEGIGFHAAKDFAKRNARVIVAGRNKERIDRAAAAIRDETGNPNVVPMMLDVSLMKSVRSFAEEFSKKENRLDILVNNAGVAGLEFTRTEEGLEVTMATNHLGHFLLTDLLLGMLKKSTPSRVVNVSSIMHNWADLELDNLNSEKMYPKQIIYNNTKLCNVLFTKELARRLEGTGVTSYSVHPGVVVTEIWRHLKFPVSWIVKFFMTFSFKSGEEGVQTTIYCSVAPGIEQNSGGYFADCRVTECSEKANDDGMAKKLWDVSERLTGMVAEDQ